MNLQEFERQTRDSIHRALDQLQTATLLLSALEIHLQESGDTVKNLSRTIETFIIDQRDRDDL
jgi:hypothetical protein